MQRFTKLLLPIFALLFSLLACRAAEQWVKPPAPTLAVNPQGTPMFNEISREQQLQIFQELWDTVDQNYLYPDFNGVDWQALGEQYRQKIETGLTTEDFYLAMDEMIAALGDEHSVYLNPLQVAEEDAEYAGNRDYVGIGIYITAVPDRQRGTILLTFPGSPAQQAGLQARDSILSVDGEPLIDENGFLKDIVRGPENTSITLRVQSPGQSPRDVQVTRQRITGSTPVPYRVFTSPEGKRIGYLLLITFADSTIGEQTGDAIRAMQAEGKLDGLIIDNRFNSGGADTELKDTLAYFMQGDAGQFISRENNRTLTIRPNDIQGTQNLPLVVIVGRETISYGEVFSGILQDQQRAYIIGEPTDGNVETLWGYDFSDGSRAWIARESFTPHNNPNQNWERDGIIPNQIILANWDETTFEADPLIQAALLHLDTR
ncbi:MAG: S41 family peptidase [Anaerolineales bacterium]